MKGTLVNAAAILIGSGLGLGLKRGIPLRYQETIMHGMALTVGLIGVQMAIKTQNILIVIISLLCGAIIGEALDLEGLLNRLGDFITRKLGTEYGNAGEGFVTASLLFCIGAMAVVGSIQDGLTGDTNTLYAKSMIDGITSIVFSAALGIGVALSSISVFLYQGTITLLAGFFGAALSESAIKEMTAVGGILIVGVSISMMEIKKIRLANLLPAIPVSAVIALLWT